MKSKDALRALAALAQETRLSIFRLLVRRGPEGFSAGEIAGRLTIPAPTLSFHLKGLIYAGLLERRKSGRSNIYRANFMRMDALVSFLTAHCCSLADGGEDSACLPGDGKIRRRRAAG